MSPHIQLNRGTATHPPSWECQGCAEQQTASQIMPKDKSSMRRLLRNLAKFEEKHADCAGRYQSMIGRAK